MATIAASTDDAGRARRRRRQDAAIACGVLAAAALVRWPYLHRIPRYTDEVTLWRLAVDIHAHGARPIVFEDTGYNGAILLYLLAAARAVAPVIETPRLLALAIGSLGVAATYLFAAVLGGRRAGIVAAAFMAVTLTPVVTYSHVLHMTALALPLQVLGWCAAARAAATGRGAWLAAAGALVGLAVQTHPLCAAFVPGLAVWLWRRPRGRELATGRWAVAAAVAGGIAVSPLAVYHLPSMVGAAESRVTGAAEGLQESWTDVSYVRGVANFAHSLADGVSSARHDPASPLARDAFAWLLLAGAAAAAAYAARHASALPLWLVASAALCMPAVMREYDNTLLARYAGLALPAVHAAVGLAVDRVLRRATPATGAATGAGAAASRVGGGPPEIRGARPRFAPATSAVTIALVGAALVGLAARLAGYYAAEIAGDRTNDDIVAIADAADQADLSIVLDGGIRRTDGRGTGPSGELHGIFAWRGVEMKKWSTPKRLDDYLLAISWPAHVIVADDTLHQIRARRELDRVPSLYVPPVADVEGWGLYHLPGDDGEE